MSIVHTVTGPIEATDLGRTLMHEHLVVGFPGWDIAAESLPRAEMRRVCIDRVAQLQDLGYATMVDPCPNDLGRDVELMVDVAEATGFNIICASGLYHEEMGATANWSLVARSSDVSASMAELFMREVTEGVGSTGVRPGILKVATGAGRMTAYERAVFEAAAAVSVVTGTPITTHTQDGTLGDVQQRVLIESGVAPEQIIIGHSCGTTDFAYHRGIVEGGSYLGFDRFGSEMFLPDADRVGSLAKLIESGAGDRIVVSHDSVWCWQGNPYPPPVREKLAKMFDPTTFDTKIIPMLRDAGVTPAAIDRLTHDDPRAFFAQEDPVTRSA